MRHGAAMPIVASGAVAIAHENAVVTHDDATAVSSGDTLCLPSEG
jgi:hypothetical protein